MPRSSDGRWTAKCKQCGQNFQQKKSDQEFCSQTCSNKAYPGTGGSKPAEGLGQRECPVCGKLFQPYRDNQVACSRKHYNAIPEVRERNNAVRRTDDYRARKNEQRRTLYAQRRKEENRAQQLRKYGLTQDEYEQRLQEQDGKCMLCGRQPKPDGVKAASRLHVDHDHATKRLRDLLCSSCNAGLGCFQDDPVLLRAAADYIERHRQNADS